MMEISIGKRTVVFTKDLLQNLYRHRQVRNNSHEAGGILLGQVRESVIYLLKASYPNEKDTSHRTGFNRDKFSAQLIINHEFINSGKKTIYLGEWHTHPEKNPKPSSRDMSMIKSQFKANKLNEDFTLLLILGIKSIFIGILDSSKFTSRSILWESGHYEI